MIYEKILVMVVLQFGTNGVSWYIIISTPLQNAHKIELRIC